jgi:NitT/TauT family transport system permease protein
MWQIRGQIPKWLAITLGVGVWVVILGLWFLIAELKLVSEMSLPDPLKVIKTLGRLIKQYNLIYNLFYSWWRIFEAFFISVIIAIPLGILMASFKPIYHFFYPLVAFMRAMPLTAFLPAFIGLFGIGEASKIAFLLAGMIPYLVSIVVDECDKVSNEILETAYTLGASKLQVLLLLMGASKAAIFQAFIILYDIGWTYVILAEIVNARIGVGYMIEAARKVLDSQRVFAGIISIGIATFLFRAFLRFLYRRLFPYKTATVS